MRHLTTEELEAGLELIRQAPKNDGRIELLVRRPDIGAREVLSTAELDPQNGLLGDSWLARGSGRNADGAAHPDVQLTLMNARSIALLAQERQRWALAGDQIYLDLDLGGENLPPGTRLALGTAVIQVSAIPHTGCQQFRERFGLEALKFVNSPAGRELNLRGINARVLQAGRVQVGDIARKL